MITQQLFLQRIRRFFIILVVCSLLMAGLYLVFNYMYPFVFAFLFAWLLNPIIKLLVNSLHCSRAIATLLTLLAFFFVSVVIFSISMVEIIQVTQYFSEQLPQYIKELSHLINHWIDTTLTPIYERFINLFSGLGDTQQTTLLDQIHQLFNRLASIGSELIEMFFMKLTNFILALPNALSTFLFIVLGTFFICKDWDKLAERYEQIIARRGRHAVATLYLQFKKTSLQYIKAQLILISFTAIILLIGFSLIGIERPLTLTLLISLVDIIPLLGTGACFFPWIIYLFLSGNYTLTIQLAILYGIILVQRQLLEPKILSQQIGLNPLMVLMIVFGSFRLLGLIGILITPIIVILLQTIQATRIPNKIWRYILEGEQI